MTDRHRGYIVTLAEDLREDDAQATINALKMVKGVVTVKPVVADIEGHISYEKARVDLANKLWQVLQDKT